MPREEWKAIAMHGPLRIVSERFPLLRDQAVRRFTRDENFRDLCEDYEACADTLARFELGGRGPEGLRNEYAALLLRLEHEMLRHLRDHMDRDDG